MLKGFEGINNIDDGNNSIIVSSTPRFSIEEILSYRLIPKSESSIFDLEKVELSLNEQRLVLSLIIDKDASIIKYNVIDKRTNKLELSISLERFPYLHIYKIIHNELCNEFLYIQSGRVGVSDSVCDKVYIIGYEHGIMKNYLDIEYLIENGLIFQDINFSIDGNSIKLIGYVRDRDCCIYNEKREVIDHQYKGHKVKPFGMCHYMINSIYLDWDDNNNVFFVRLIQ